MEGWKGKPAKEYPGWFLNILATHGVNSETEIEGYLEPEYESLTGWDSFSNVKEAVDLVARAKTEKWPICVYGDYDVDGVTSTALAVESLNKIGIQNIETYIPHRQDEGYGLNRESIRELIKKGIKLMVVVDSGVTAGEIIDDPEFKLLEFLVIDHHEIDKAKLPKKAIILHPELTQKGVTTEPFSAAAMVFFFARALQHKFKAEFPAGQEKWLLDLVALSTIADVMPLSGNNRILAKFGLKVLSKTKRVGILELAKVSSVAPGDISAYSVGFLLAPRLNAAGRLETAQTALKLLQTNDQKEARSLASELNKLNTERQQLCEKILEEAKAEIEKSGNKDAEIYLLSSKNWPRGVVGIIAGRLAESYSRPMIIFEHDGAMHHGSARSVGDFDITAALAECEDCVEKFGGHAKAAGLTVSDEKFVIFADKMLEITKKRIKATDLRAELTIDTEIKEGEIKDDALELIEKMEPFGYGNTTPVLITKGVEMEDAKLVGAEKNHLKFKLKKSGVSAIQFRNDTVPDVKNKWDLAFQLRWNEWNNRRSIDVRVIDLKQSK